MFDAVAARSCQPSGSPARRARQRRPARKCRHGPEQRPSIERRPVVEGLDYDLPLMHQPVVEAAERHEVGELGFSAVGASVLAAFTEGDAAFKAVELRARNDRRGDRSYGA